MSESFTPKWFQNACGMMLTYLINRPEGVHQLIKGVLNIGQETNASGNENETKKKYTIIATVVSNPVLNNSKYQDLENYFSSICPQILEILIKSQVYLDILKDITFTNTIPGLFLSIAKIILLLIGSSE